MRPRTSKGPLGLPPNQGSGGRPGPLARQLEASARIPEVQSRRILFFLCMAAQAAGGALTLTRAQQDAFNPKGEFKLTRGPEGTLIASYASKPEDEAAS